MEVQVAVLADCANVAAGEKLNIMGIFDTIFARDFPTVHPFMALALRFRIFLARWLPRLLFHRRLSATIRVAPFLASNANRFHSFGCMILFGTPREVTHSSLR